MKNIDKAHEINRIIMRKIHSVCKKYNITYFYDSGSLIGAVRHHGFIPWDDDIDLALPREEYKKLLEVPREEWGEDFELVRAEDFVKDGFFDFVAHVVYLKDSVPLKSYEKAGLFLPDQYRDKMVIDLFILDNAYDSRFLQKILTTRLILVYGQAMGHRAYIDYSEYSFVQKIIIKIMTSIGKRKTLQEIRQKYDKLSSSVGEKSNHVFCSNYPIPDLGMYCKKEWYAETVPLQVDDDYFDCPKGYHEILTTIYGDYMKLPPEEARVPQHVKPDEQ